MQIKKGWLIALLLLMLVIGLTIGSRGKIFSKDFFNKGI